MTLNEVLAAIQSTGAQIIGKEPDPNGDGWIVFIERRGEMIYPFAYAHCIPVHVSHLENPELHEQEAKAILRRFAAAGVKKPPRKAEG
jgi:hypothetical protein